MNGHISDVRIWNYKTKRWDDADSLILKKRKELEMAKLKKLERPQIEKISILPRLNGYIVTVGCRELVFTDDAELVKYLGAYLKDPVGYKELYGSQVITANITIPLYDADSTPATAW